MAGHIFRVGALDLSDFVKVQDEDGLDPFNPDFQEPQFSNSPAVEGGTLVQTKVGLKEMVFPLALQPQPLARTNLATNPKAGDGTTTGWTNNGLATFEAVTLNTGSVPARVTGMPAGVETALHGIGDTSGDSARLDIAVTSGQTYRYSLWLYLVSNTATGVQLEIRNAASAVKATGTAQTTTGSWTRLDLSVTADATETWKFNVRQPAAGGTEFYWTAALIEQSSTLGDWFDGDDLDAQWTGTPEQSTSTTRTGTDGLNQMRQELVQSLAQPAPLRCQWKEPASTSPTFFDIESGRVEPAQHYFRQLVNWGDHVLRLWVQPYGHTATERIVATGGATAAAFTVALPSYLGGDVAALGVARLTVGSFVPLAGNIVAIAPLSHPSYQPWIPAASLANIAAEATLKGASGAQGSQIVGLVPSFGLATTGATYPQAFQFSLSPASVYAGRHRIFALAKSNLYSGNRLRLFDPSNQPVGPTAAADFSPDGFAPVDLGVLSVPSNIDTSTYTCYVQGGAPNTASESVLRPGMLASHTYGLHVNGLVLLPEERLALVNDTARTPVVWDSFSAAGSHSLLGQAPKVGGVGWAAAPAIAPTALWQQEDNGGEVGPLGASQHNAANVLNGLMVSDMRARLAVFIATQTSNIGAGVPAVEVHRGATANAVVWQMLGGNNANRQLALYAGNGASLLASVALASFAGPEFLVELGCQGPRGWISLRPFSQPKAELIASLGASSAAFQQAGEIAVAAQGTGFSGAGGTSHIALRDVVIDAVPSVGRPARGVYLLDAVNNRSHRQDASQTYLAPVGGNQVGQGANNWPTPTTVAIAVLETALEGEPANDRTDADLRARERFSFLR